MSDRTWGYLITHVFKSISGESGGVLNQNRIYQLQENVSIKKDKEAFFLVSDFPLRAVRLDSAWQPFFQGLRASGEKETFRLPPAPANVSDDQLHGFLDRLVTKGFLLREDIPSQSFIPGVSIIIPVRNRPQDLDRCLKSLAEVDYPRECLEVIVVDDGSGDNTPEVARHYPVILMRNSVQQGASFSRNRGAEQARGELLCFLDSDCTVEPGWLRELVYAFEDSRVSAGGGEVLSQLSHTRLDRYEQVKSSLHMGFQACDSENGNPFFYLPSCNFAVRRDAFKGIGGFKEEMTVGEDVDLCWRLIDRGGVIAYRPRAKVFHRHRNRVTAFSRRRFQYGTSEPLLQSGHLNRGKIFPVYSQPMLFWLIVMISGIFFPLLSIGALALFLGDAGVYHHKSVRMGLPFSRPLVFRARFRHYLSALYHLAAFVSRYYLVFALPLFLFSPNWVTVCPIVLHLGAGMVDFIVKKPKLDPFSFMILFSLEQLSYQAGVWVGCIKHRFFRPVAPRLILQFLNFHQ